MITEGDYSDSLKIAAYSAWEYLIYYEDPHLGVELNQKIITIIDRNISACNGNRERLKYYLTKKSQCYNNIGLTQSETLQDNTKALENLNESLILAEYLNDSLQMSYVVNNIGGIYKFEGWYEEAHECYVRSLYLYDEDEESNAISYDNIGLYFNEVAQYDSALFYYEKSREICEKYQPSFNYARTLGNLASVNYNTKHYEKAIQFGKHSLIVSREVGFDMGISFANQIISMTYFEMKEFDLAVKFGIDGYNLALESEDLWNQEYCAKILYRAYKAQNKLDQSLFYHEKYVELSDSLFNEDKQEALLRLDFQFQEQRRTLDDSLAFANDKIILKQNHNIEIQQATNRQKILIVVSIAALIFGAVFFWSYRRKSKDKERIEKARNDLDLEKKKKEIFIAQTTHEIRSPLHAISGNLELLKLGGVETSENKEYLSAAISSSEHMLRVVNDILELSKIESGKIEINPEPFVLRDFMMTTINSIRPLAVAKDLDLDLIVSSNLPEVIIADSLRLKQVLINLINNGIKFTEKGYVELKIELRNEKVYFEVNDSGFGIEKSELSQVFELYDQLQSEKKTTLIGTGLGLAISKEIISLFGGELEVESEVNIGTKFYFSIPLHTGVLRGKPIEHKLVDLSEKRILIVDDNLMSLNTAVSMLTFLNAKIYSAISATAAFEILKKNQVDLILMDMAMPMIDGYEAVDCIKNELKLNVPIVGISGYTSSAHLKRMKASGILENLTKPFNMVDLSECLARNFSDISFKIAPFLRGRDSFQTFKQDVPKILEQAEIAVHKGDLKSLEFHIHKVKPCYFYIDEIDLFDYVTKFENEINNLADHEISQRLEYLKAETENLIQSK